MISTFDDFSVKIFLAISTFDDFSVIRHLMISTVDDVFDSHIIKMLRFRVKELFIMYS